MKRIDTQQEHEQNQNNNTNTTKKHISIYISKLKKLLYFKIVCAIRRLQAFHADLATFSRF